jgi:hypothetical protein
VIDAARSDALQKMLIYSGIELTRPTPHHRRAVVASIATATTQPCYRIA